MNDSSAAAAASAASASSAAAAIATAGPPAAPTTMAAFAVFPRDDADHHSDHRPEDDVQQYPELHCPHLVSFASSHFDCLVVAWWLDAGTWTGPSSQAAVPAVLSGNALTRRDGQTHPDPRGGGRDHRLLSCLSPRPGVRSARLPGDDAAVARRLGPSAPAERGPAARANLPAAPRRRLLRAAGRPALFTAATIRVQAQLPGRGVQGAQPSVRQLARACQQPPPPPPPPPQPPPPPPPPQDEPLPLEEPPPHDVPLPPEPPAAHQPPEVDGPDRRPTCCPPLPADAASAQATTSSTNSAMNMTMTNAGIGPPPPSPAKRGPASCGDG
jgi:hypothetical protein